MTSQLGAGRWINVINPWKDDDDDDDGDDDDDDDDDDDTDDDEVFEYMKIIYVNCGVKN